MKAKTGTVSRGKNQMVIDLKFDYLLKAAKNFTRLNQSWLGYAEKEI